MPHPDVFFYFVKIRSWSPLLWSGDIHGAERQQEQTPACEKNSTPEPLFILPGNARSRQVTTLCLTAAHCTDTDTVLRPVLCPNAKMALPTHTAAPCPIAALGLVAVVNHTTVLRTKATRSPQPRYAVLPRTVSLSLPRKTPPTIVVPPTR